MRNLVVCADGTWNSKDNKDGDAPAPTNVAKLDASAPDIETGSKQQLTYYHEGVGASGTWLERKLGGGFGFGLNDNIKSIYKWLCCNYKAKDKIFLFGFSRGAFTVRTLAGMVDKIGVMDFVEPNLSQAEIWSKVDEAFEIYRDENNDDTSPLSRDETVLNKTNIHFLGVWDTVGSLGIPDELALLNLFEPANKYSFHNTTLGMYVQHARHAIAMDERRRNFTPTLWTGYDEKERDIKQVWFPGVHSDIGGGYAETELSDLPFKWMIEEAMEHGLIIRDGVMEQMKGNAQGLLHNSVTGIFEKLKTRPRATPKVANASKSKNIHKSVFDRQKNPPLTQPNYWPTKIFAKGKTLKMDVFARQRWNYTGVYLEAGQSYELTASGEWLDASMKANANGIKKYSAFGRVIHASGSTIGIFEKLFKKLSGNNQVDAKLTKRMEEPDWFALIGVIANGGGTDNKNGNPIDHQTFTIGEQYTLTPGKSGYLYCFANDAWNFYDNNRGSVALEIKHV